MPLSSPARAAALLGLVLLVIAAASATVAGQTEDLLPAGELSFEAGEFNGTAVPGGPVVTSMLTITYGCGDFAGDITIVHVADANGTATVDDAAITPEGLPDCAPGSTGTATANVSVTAGASAIAGGLILVNITVTGTDALGGMTQAWKDIGPTVGSVVAVTFAADPTDFEAGTGDDVEISIGITSTSNTAVRIISALTGLPPAWTIPTIPELQVQSPLTLGETGQATLTFNLTVPDDAERGEYMFNYTGFARGLPESSVQSAPKTEPLTLTVTGGGGGGDDDDDKDSPGVEVLPVMLALAAVVALARRRAR